MFRFFLGLSLFSCSTALASSGAPIDFKENFIREAPPQSFPTRLAGNKRRIEEENQLGPSNKKRKFNSLVLNVDFDSKAFKEKMADVNKNGRQISIETVKWAVDLLNKNGYLIPKEYILKKIPKANALPKTANLLSDMGYFTRRHATEEEIKKAGLTYSVKSRLNIYCIKDQSKQENVGVSSYQDFQQKAHKTLNLDPSVINTLCQYIQDHDGIAPFSFKQREAILSDDSKNLLSLFPKAEGEGAAAHKLTDAIRLLEKAQLLKKSSFTRGDFVKFGVLYNNKSHPKRFFINYSKMPLSQDSDVNSTISVSLSPPLRAAKPINLPSVMIQEAGKQTPLLSSSFQQSGGKGLPAELQKYLIEKPKDMAIVPLKGSPVNGNMALAPPRISLEGRRILEELPLLNAQKARKPVEEQKVNMSPLSTQSKGKELPVELQKYILSKPLL